MPCRVIVIEHEQHGDAVAIRHSAVFAFIHTLIDNDIAVGVFADLVTASELFVDVKDVGDAAVIPLAEEGGVGMPWKSAAGFAERFGLVVAVGVKQPETCSCEIHGVLQFAARGVVVVVALRVHHCKRGVEATSSSTIKATETIPRTAEAIVELLA